MPAHLPSPRPRRTAPRTNALALLASAIAGMLALGSSLALAQSRLEVTQGQNRFLTLHWPTTETGFVLETSPSLAVPAWSVVPESPVASNGRFRVTVLAGDQVRFFRLRRNAAPAAPRIASTSPGSGESGVAVTRETIFRFNTPLAPDVVVTADDLYAEVGSRRALARAELSTDRLTATLFYLENLPGSTRVRVTLDGTRLRDASGIALDADGDGQPGGARVLEFNTAVVTGLPNTGVAGRVFASEKNADGSNRALANVTITVDGAEETLRTVTDANGSFLLSPAPAGRFFVHVDGRTAVGSQWPGGAYYPFVGKAWEAVAGTTNPLAGGSGEIFLPLIQGDTLTPVSTTAETKVAFSPSVVAANPNLAGVEVSVPANALFSDNGTRGGSVGIAPVPPDRLPEPLPPGLNLPLVITVQTDGAANFDRPVPVRFPNLPDPVTGLTLPPGAKTVLWSFNHDTGRWEPQGLMTISDDGRFAVSDPGTGIRQPGWHGIAGGSSGSGPRRRGTGGGSGGDPDGDGDDECEGEDCECTQEITCVTPKPGKGVAHCALECLGDVVDDIFGDGEKPQRTAFETGLRCIGGPDKCPGRPEDTLDQKRRDCMDECTDPAPDRITYVVPCEGFTSPCGGASPALHALAPNADITGLIPDRMVEQRKLWEVEGQFLIQLTGTPKILESESHEVPLLSAFFDAFSDRVQPAGPSGVNLSSTERAELIALPRPTHFTAAEWAAMIDRLDGLQGKPLPTALATADQRLSQLTDLLRSRGWRNRGDGLLHALTRRSRHASPEVGSEEFPARNHFFYLKDHRNGFVQRGRLNALGQFDGLILAPGGYYSIAYLDPVTRRLGTAFFQARQAGSATVIPTAPLTDPGATTGDTDSDGLTDLAEKILGTSATKADSDNDGLSDGLELSAGTHPLDGVGLPTGVVASSPTPGKAFDIAAGNNLAVVACTEGLAVFDVTDPTAPVQVAVIPGPAHFVVLQDTLALAAFGDGVRLIDLSTPAVPVVRWFRSDLGLAQALALNGDVAFVARGTHLYRIQLGSGLTDLLPDAHPRFIDSMMPRGDLLYLLGDDVLTILRTRELLERVGTATAPGSRGAGGRPRRLFLDGQRLYAQHHSGFNVFDLTDPLQPVLANTKTTRQQGWRQFVTTGSGLALAADGPNSTEDGPHDVSLYRVTNGGLDADFVTTFPTPGSPFAVAIAGGRAYAADGNAGLAVINFLPPDLGTQAPTVTVVVDATADPLRVEGDTVVRLAAVATDDVAVRHADLFVNGQWIKRDDSHPFEIYFRVAAVSPTNTAFTVQIQAEDLAGNRSITPTTTVAVVGDATAPSVQGLEPGAGSEIPPAVVQDVYVMLREPIVSPVSNTTLSLHHSGPDGQWGTADDAAVPGSVQWIAAERTLHLHLAETFVSGRYRATLAAGIADAAGNARSQPLSWEFSVGAPPEIRDIFPPSNLVRVGGTLDEIRFGYSSPVPRVLLQNYQWNVVYRPLTAGGNPGAAIPITPLIVTHHSDGRTVSLRTTGNLAPGSYVVTGSGLILTAMRWEFVFRDVPNEAIGVDSFAGTQWKYFPGVGIGDQLIINVPGKVAPVHVRDIHSVIAYTDAALDRQRVEVPTTLQFLAGLRISSSTFGPGSTEVHGPVSFSASTTSPLDLGAHTLHLHGGGSSRTRIEMGNESGALVNHVGSSLVLSNRAEFYGSGGVGGRVLNLGTLQSKAEDSITRFEDVRLRNDGRFEALTGTTRVEDFENTGVTDVAPGARLMLAARTRGGVSSAITGSGILEFGEYNAISRQVESMADAEIRGPFDFAGDFKLVAGRVELWRPWIRPSGSNELLNSSTLVLIAPSRIGTLDVTDGNLTCNSDTIISNLTVGSRADFRSATRILVTGNARIASGLDAIGGGIVEFAGTTVITNRNQSGGVHVGNGILRNSGVWRQAIAGTQASFISRVNENDVPGTGVFENTGTFEQVTERVFEIHIPFHNAGRVTFARTTVIVNADPAFFPRRNGAFLPLPGSELVLNNTTLDYSSAGTLDLAAGTLRGVGTVRAVGGSPLPRIINRGVLRPGNPTGTLVLRATGGFEQTATGEMVIPLRAAGGGDLRFDGTAVTLAGKLSVELLDGFSPEIGRTFSVFSANGRTGEFTTLNLPSPGPGRKFEVVYGANGVTLRVVAQ